MTYLIALILGIGLVYFALQSRWKQMEIRREQARLSASLQSLNIGFMMTDLNGHITLVNSLAKRLLCSDNSQTSTFGVFHSGAGQVHDCQEEEIEKNMREVYKIAPLIEKCIDKKAIQTLDLVIHNRVVHLLFSPIVLVLKNKLQVLGCVVVLEDVTEAKLLERSRDEFFSIASHELRTPLTAIRGNTSMIKQYLSARIQDPQLLEMINDIHESSLRLIDIVNDFLDTSRLEQGRINFQRQEFNIQEVISEVVKELGELASKKGIYLKVDSPQDISVYADQNRVKQVLTNLVGNAIKFTDQGGVTILSTKTSSQLKISVADSGKGIPEKNQSLLFRKFQQAGDNLLTRDATRGTGLGLYISKMLVEGMGGVITLDSSLENKGSIFSFTLPLSKTAELEKTFIVQDKLSTHFKEVDPQVGLAQSRSLM